MRRALVAMLAVGAALGPWPARAATSLEVGWMSSTERGDTGNAMTLGARFGPVRARESGAELGLGLYAGFTNTTVQVGSVGATLDLDLAHAAKLGAGAAWTSRAGTTLLAGVGEGGGGMAAGFNAGLGILAVPTSAVGFRADLGYRVVFARGSHGLLSVSFGLAWPPRDGEPRRE